MGVPVDQGVEDGDLPGRCRDVQGQLTTARGQDKPEERTTLRLPHRQVGRPRSQTRFRSEHQPGPPGVDAVHRGRRIPEQVIELLGPQRLLHSRQRARVGRPGLVDHWRYLGHSSTVNSYPGTECSRPLKPRGPNVGPSAELRPVRYTVDVSRRCFSIARLAGISFAASRRTSSGTRTFPIPWPSKSTEMVSRDRVSVSGSTMTSTVARIDPSMPCTPQVLGGSTWVSSELDGRLAPPMRRVVEHSAPNSGCRAGPCDRR